MLLWGIKKKQTKQKGRYNIFLIAWQIKNCVVNLNSADTQLLTRKGKK